LQIGKFVVDCCKSNLLVTRGSADWDWNVKKLRPYPPHPYHQYSWLQRGIYVKKLRPHPPHPYHRYPWLHIGIFVVLDCFKAYCLPKMITKQMAAGLGQEPTSK
jgi:hypothetical protein